MNDYLDRLPLLNDEERRQLRSIGAPTPLALQASLKASPESFLRILGSKQRYHQLLTALDDLIPEKEKAQIEALPQNLFALGVPVEQATSAEVRRTPLIEERDRVYDEIQRLRQADDHSFQTHQRLEELEKRLKEILKQLAEAAA